MKKKSSTPPTWVTRGKTIRGLIEELQSFENQDLEVKYLQIMESLSNA